MVKVGSVYMGNLGQTSLGSNEGFLYYKVNFFGLGLCVLVSLSLSESFTYFWLTLNLLCC